MATDTAQHTAIVRLRNINPLGRVDLPLLQREGDPYDVEGDGCLEAGEEFDCPADLAGRAPQLVHRDAVSEEDATEDQPARDAYDEWDLGEGLLAQVGNYELVQPTTTSSTPDSNDPKQDGDPR